MRSYLNKLIFPIIWEILFILSCMFLTEEYITVTNFIFYLGIAVYFILLGDFNWQELTDNIKSGKKFWSAVGLTILGMIVAYAISIVPQIIKPDLDDRMINLVRTDWFRLILFALSTMILPPLAEELFYRKAMINMSSKTALIVSSIIAMSLYALEHSLGLYGFLMAFIWAIPFTVSYIKTKNIYIPIVAHFIVNFLVNGSDVVFTAIRLLN